MLFHIADTVIQMDNYHPLDITEKAKALCGEFPLNAAEKTGALKLPVSRRVMTKLLQSPRPEKCFRWHPQWKSCGYPFYWADR